MARKKTVLSLRRPADIVDPLQADRFVHGSVDAPPPPPASVPTAILGEAPLKAATALGRSIAETPERPDIQTSERQDVQASDGAARAAAPASKALVYRKRTDDLRRRMTIYLSEDLSRRLRVYAAEQDQDYSVVLSEALSALLAQKGVR